MPRSTTYPARSFSSFGSHIKLIEPSPATACSSFGAAGGNKNGRRPTDGDRLVVVFDCGHRRRRRGRDERHADALRQRTFASALRDADRDVGTKGRRPRRTEERLRRGFDGGLFFRSIEGN